MQFVAFVDNVSCHGVTSICNPDCRILSIYNVFMLRIGADGGIYRGSSFDETPHIKVVMPCRSKSHNRGNARNGTSVPAPTLVERNQLRPRNAASRVFDCQIDRCLTVCRMKLLRLVSSIRSLRIGYSSCRARILHHFAQWINCLNVLSRCETSISTRPDRRTGTPRKIHRLIGRAMGFVLSRAHEFVPAP